MVRRSFPQIYADQGRFTDVRLLFETYLRICALISVDPRETTPGNTK